MGKQATTIEETRIPLGLAMDNVRSYRIPTLEAIRRANLAVRQRDHYRVLAIEAECRRMRGAHACPGDDVEPCPLVFGEHCRACSAAVDRAAPYK